MNGRNWSPDIVRILQNWAQWVSSGSSSSRSPYPAYNLEPPGRRAQVTVPLLVGEAIDTDRTIGQMREDLRQALQVYYTNPDKTDADKVRLVGCSLNTYKVRLDRAHVEFSRLWYARARTNQQPAAEIEGPRRPMRRRLVRDLKHA